jgi:hypothetical protein
LRPGPVRPVVLGRNYTTGSPFKLRDGVPFQIEGDRTPFRQTNEQRAATEQLRALAGPYRVTQDVEGWPVLEGRLGRIEWYCDGVNCHSCRMPGVFALAVFTDRRLVRGRLLAIPGVLRHQTGDTELRAVFPPKALLTVAAAIKARRRRQGGASPEVLTKARLRARLALLGATS